MNYKELVNKPEYDFLLTNKHLGNNIMLLALGGSHAYGTNIKTSDIDIRGCAFNKPQDLIGLSSFDEVVDKNTDTTIFSFMKLIKLLCNCNPNTIEILGCLPEHYLFLTEQAKQLIDNRKMFLSRKAAFSFGGYANAQLRKLENALARDEYSLNDKEKHILGTLTEMLKGIKYRYKDIKTYANKDFLNTIGEDKSKTLIESEKNGIYLYIDKSEKDELDNEIHISARFEGYPLRDFKNVVFDMNNIVKDFEKINQKNKKKDDAHLNKHAMHLVRLFLMAIDVFEKEEIITYRKDEHDLLMSIRNGEFQKEDRTFRAEFFEMVDNYQKRLEYAVENSGLPEYPDYKKIEEFVMDVNKYSLLRNS